MQNMDTLCKSGNFDVPFEVEIFDTVQSANNFGVEDVSSNPDVLTNQNILKSTDMSTPEMSAKADTKENPTGNITSQADDTIGVTTCQNIAAKEGTTSTNLPEEAVDPDLLQTFTSGLEQSMTLISKMSDGERRKAMETLNSLIKKVVPSGETETGTCDGPSGHSGCDQSVVSCNIKEENEKVGVRSQTESETGGVELHIDNAPKEIVVTPIDSQLNQRKNESTSSVTAERKKFASTRLKERKSVVPSGSARCAPYATNNACVQTRLVHTRSKMRELKSKESGITIPDTKTQQKRHGGTENSDTKTNTKGKGKRNLKCDQQSETEDKKGLGIPVAQNPEIDSMAMTCPVGKRGRSRKSSNVETNVVIQQDHDYWKQPLKRGTRIAVGLIEPETVEREAEAGEKHGLLDRSGRSERSDKSDRSRRSQRTERSKRTEEPGYVLPRRSARSRQHATNSSKVNIAKDASKRREINQLKHDASEARCSDKVKENIGHEDAEDRLLICDDVCTEEGNVEGLESNIGSLESRTIGLEGNMVGLESRVITLIKEEKTVQKEDKAEKDKVKTVSKLSGDTENEETIKDKFKCEKTETGGQVKNKRPKIAKIVAEKDCQIVKIDEVNCPRCGKPFPDKPSMKAHKAEHGTGSPTECYLCQKRFGHSSNLKRHVRETHQGHRPYKCCLCNLCFFTAQSAQAHILSAHVLQGDQDAENEARYTGASKTADLCESCGDFFPSKVLLYDHLKSHHGQTVPRLYKCDQCERMFQHKSNLNRHVVQSHGKRVLHTCVTCEESYRSRFTLLLHRNRKHKDLSQDQVDELEKMKAEKGGKCKVCLKVFNRMSSLQQHMAIHNPLHKYQSPLQKYQCPTCSKKFSYKSNLKRHLLVHDGVKKWECPDCKRKFTEKKSMEVHQRIHTGEKPYRCKDCGKSYRQLSTYQSHLIVHTRERNYLCTECGKTFLRRSHQLQHMKRHNTAPSHKCDQCAMSFFRAGDLRRHKATHLTLRPHMCDICNQTFTRKDYRDAHVNAHLGRNPYHCPHCHLQFKDSASRSKHVKLKHLNPLDDGRTSIPNDIDSGQENSAAHPIPQDTSLQSIDNVPEAPSLSRVDAMGPVLASQIGATCDNALTDLGHAGAVLATNDLDPTDLALDGAAIVADPGIVVNDPSTLLQQALANTNLSSLESPSQIRIQEVNSEGLITNQYILLVNTKPQGAPL